MNYELDCIWCGKRPAAGFAMIGKYRYCHGDDDPSPTCYERGQWAATDDLLSAEKRRAERANRRPPFEFALGA